MKGITIHGIGESAILEFGGYGVNAPDLFIPVNQIAQFFAINYNGNHGTEIRQICGTASRVDAWPQDVARAIAESTFDPEAGE